MQYNMSNQDAGVFARTFYEELGKGSRIEEAVKAGRIGRGMRFPRWAHPRFGTPVVYLQSENAIVFAPETEEETPEPVESESVSAPTQPPTPRPAPKGDMSPAVERSASAPATADIDRERSGFGR
jgi:hypothetical protein